MGDHGIDDSLRGSMGERCSVRNCVDHGGDMVGVVGSRDNLVDQADPFGPWGVDRLGGEQQPLGL